MAADAAPRAVVIGAGAFGLALAQVLRRRGAEVTLWSRRQEVVLPEGIRRAASLAEATRGGRLLFFCAPAAHARPLLRQLGDVVDGGHLLVHVARGLESPAGRPVSEIVREETPIRRVGVLAGPLVPAELAAALPSAIVVASRFPEVPKAAQEALAQPALRVYASDDLAGVELAAALMTVVALATGIAAGLGGGISTRALVVARGLAQSARILEAAGAKARTLAGLGGIGEVFVTAQGVTSPDYELGLAIARGEDPEAAMLQSGRSAEGPQVARCMRTWDLAHHVRAPLFDAIAEIVEHKRPPEQVLRELLGGSAPTEL